MKFSVSTVSVPVVHTEVRPSVVERGGERIERGAMFATVCRCGVRRCEKPFEKYMPRFLVSSRPSCISVEPAMQGLLRAIAHRTLCAATPTEMQAGVVPRRVLCSVMGHDAQAHEATLRRWAAELTGGKAIAAAAPRLASLRDPRSVVP